MEGDAVPVSVFVDNANGSIPSGTAAYEKRGIAVDIPKWDPDKCMQCNWCSYVCPHAVIRPFAVTEQQAEKAGAASVILLRAITPSALRSPFPLMTVLDAVPV